MRKTEAGQKVEQALSKLAQVRDLLTSWENGDNPIGVGEQDCAYFINAGLVKACRQLEATLVECGLVDPNAYIFMEPMVHHDPA
jgi:hypothetical protein